MNYVGEPSITSLLNLFSELLPPTLNWGGGQGRELTKG